MKIYETDRIESAILEMKSRAKERRSVAGVESEKHGQTSLEARQYAAEACAYENCSRIIERALSDIMANNQ